MGYFNLAAEINAMTLPIRQSIHSIETGLFLDITKIVVPLKNMS